MFKHFHPLAHTHPYFDTMKFLVVLSALASLAAAQMAVIRAPPAQSTFAPGEQFIVDVDRPVSRCLPVSIAMAHAGVAFRILLRARKRSP